MSGDSPAGIDLVQELHAFRGTEITLLRPRDSEALLDEEAFEGEEFLPYWAELWPSGRALADRLSGRALLGARVLELGCGLGLPSLVAGACGGRVLATDWSEEALTLLARNAAANGLPVQTLRASWSQPGELLARGPFDLILGADLCYERRNVALLLELMPRLGPEVWLADPGRSFTEAFLEQAPRFWERETVAHRGIFIHRLRRVAGAAGPTGALPGIGGRPDSRS